MNDTETKALIAELLAALKDTLSQLQKYEPCTVFVAAENAIKKAEAAKS